MVSGNQCLKACGLHVGAKGACPHCAHEALVPLFKHQPQRCVCTYPTLPIHPPDIFTLLYYCVYSTGGREVQSAYRKNIKLTLRMHSNIQRVQTNMCFPGGSVLKNLSANAEDLSLIPGLGKSPGERHGNPLQYCCLGNPIDRGGWQATVHSVTKSWT